MERFLVGQFGNETESRTNVVYGEIVFALNLFKGHTAGQAADDRGHWDARTPNDRLAMMDSGIQNDSIGNGHSDNMIVRVGEIRPAIKSSEPWIVSPAIPN